MKKTISLILIAFLSISFSGLKAETIRLDQLDVSKGTTGWPNHPTQVNKSIEGNPLTMKGKVYQYGVGAHAPNRFDIKVNGATRFSCVVGIDDEVRPAPANEGIAGYNIIQVKNGVETIVKSGVITSTDESVVEIDVDITGWDFISLETTESNGNNWSDHVDWCDAVFEYTGEAPFTVYYDEMIPKFHCMFNHFSLPNTRMMHRYKTLNPKDVIHVENLPAGLTFNPQRNIVEGKLPAGKYSYTVIATTTDGSTITKEATIDVRSNLISPTPLMGWMSWNVYEGDITEEIIKKTANAVVEKGLLAAGYNYIAIDDLWHGSARDANGYLDCNYSKFPSGMKALVDYVHDKGLKIGIYSDAATRTCAGAIGSLGYEEKDAEQYAKWGFDFLKYDYCFAPTDQATAIERYTKMGDALKATGRDFYYLICEWGERKPWEWASAAGGHSWRTTLDSRDTWDHGRYDTEHCGVVQAIDIMRDLAYYSGPNHFNDADMLMTGLYGTGKSSSHDGANGMTNREYQAQFSMWSIFASPLIVAFDVTTMNDETKRILTNPEVIAINQDKMGLQAECIYNANQIEVYAKDLENGDVAVAFLNRKSTAAQIEIGLDKLFLEGSHIVRDLWAHEDVMTVSDKISATVQSHEVKLYRVRPAGTSTEELNETDKSIKIMQDKNRLLIQFTDFQNDTKQVQLLDISGKTLMTKSCYEKTASFDTSNLSKGVYLVKATTGDFSITEKHIIN